MAESAAICVGRGHVSRGTDFGQVRVRLRVSGQLWKTCHHASNGSSVHDFDDRLALEGARHFPRRPSIFYAPLFSCKCVLLVPDAGS